MHVYEHDASVLIVHPHIGSDEDNLSFFVCLFMMTVCTYYKRNVTNFTYEVNFINIYV